MVRAFLCTPYEAGDVNASVADKNSCLIFLCIEVLYVEYLSYDRCIQDTWFHVYHLDLMDPHTSVFMNNISFDVLLNMCTTGNIK